MGTGRERWIFVVSDRADSVLGCVLVCSVFFDVSTAVLVGTFIIGLGGHMATTLTLYLAGIRTRPL